MTRSRWPSDDTVFDPDYPPQQMTPEFWEDVWLGALADWLLRQMEAGRIPEPGIYGE